MKKLSILSLALIFAFTSCEVTEVLEQEPAQSLSDATAIVDAQSAETALTGVYSGLQSGNYYGRMHLAWGAVLSGYMGSTSQTTRNSTFQSETNTNDPNDNTLKATWQFIYRVANRASNVVTLVEGLSDSDGFAGSRRTQIIAEARFLRALAHFDLLSYFGRHWDNSSPLGIPLRLEPGNVSNSEQPRATVAEVYASINEDLDFAIANAPAFSSTVSVSSIAATALKAKVALFQQDYAQAATLANTVINSGTFQLEASYSDIFVNRLNSSELIFSPFFSQIEGSGHSFFILTPSSPLGQGRWDYGPTAQFTSVMSGDPREAASIGTTADGVEVVKYPNLTAGDDPAYVLRLAEIHLIRAEALARSGGSVADIQAELNAVRTRAGLANTTASTVADLLTAIQAEKVLELAFENGTEWFDAIRYDNIQALKASVTSDNQYVLPISQDEVDNNANVEQSPGY